MKSELNVIDSQAFAAPNKCVWTNEEKLHKSVKLTDSLCIRLYKARYNKWRGIALVDGRAVSGVVLDPDGTVSMRATDYDYQGHGLTNKIVAVMKGNGIEVLRSDWQTPAGAACYKARQTVK